LATAPEGFTTAEVAQAVRGRTGWDEAQYPTDLPPFEEGLRLKSPCPWAYCACNMLSLIV